MIFPPSIIRIRLARKKKKNYNLWLPLFLFWPGMGIFAIAATFLLLPISLLCPQKISFKKSLLGPAGLLILFCRTRGFRLHVEETNKNEELLFALI